MRMSLLMCFSRYWGLIELDTTFKSSLIIKFARANPEIKWNIKFCTAVILIWRHNYIHTYIHTSIVCCYFMLYWTIWKWVHKLLLIFFANLILYVTLQEPHLTSPCNDEFNISTSNLNFSPHRIHACLARLSWVQFQFKSI